MKGLGSPLINVAITYRSSEMPVRCPLDDLFLTVRAQAATVRGTATSCMEPKVTSHNQCAIFLSSPLLPNNNVAEPCNIGKEKGQQRLEVTYQSQGDAKCTVCRKVITTQPEDSGLRGKAVLSVESMPKCDACYYCPRCRVNVLEAIASKQERGKGFLACHWCSWKSDALRESELPKWLFESSLSVVRSICGASQVAMSLKQAAQPLSLSKLASQIPSADASTRAEKAVSMDAALQQVTNGIVNQGVIPLSQRLQTNERIPTAMISLFSEEGDVLELNCDWEPFIPCKVKKPADMKLLHAADVATAVKEIGSGHLLSASPPLVAFIPDGERGSVVPLTAASATSRRAVVVRRRAPASGNGGSSFPISASGALDAVPQTTVLLDPGQLLSTKRNEALARSGSAVRFLPQLFIAADQTRRSCSDGTKRLYCFLQPLNPESVVVVSGLRLVRCVGCAAATSFPASAAVGSLNVPMRTHHGSFGGYRQAPQGNVKAPRYYADSALDTKLFPAEASVSDQTRQPSGEHIDSIWRSSLCRGVSLDASSSLLFFGLELKRPPTCDEAASTQCMVELEISVLLPLEVPSGGGEVKSSKTPFALFLEHWIVCDDSLGGAAIPTSGGLPLTYRAVLTFEW